MEGRVPPHRVAVALDLLLALAAAHMEPRRKCAALLGVPRHKVDSTLRHLAARLAAVCALALRFRLWARRALPRLSHTL